jgi:hypothetical protein
MEHFKKVACWYREPSPTRTTSPARRPTTEVTCRKEAIQKLVHEANERLRAAKPGEAFPKNPEPNYPEETRQS